MARSRDHFSAQSFTCHEPSNNAVSPDTVVIKVSLCLARIGFSCWPWRQGLSSARSSEDDCWAYCQPMSRCAYR